MSSEEEINADSSPESPGNPKDSALFKPKSKPKVIRVFTVLAYILSVSLAAIFLSIYYIFMWEGQPQMGARRSPPLDISNGAAYSRPPTPVPSTAHYGLVTTNIPLEIYHYTENYTAEMQQQITTAKEETFSPDPTTEENSIWGNHNVSLDNNFVRSAFIQKLMYRKYPYDEND